jgi:hypothetical protein
LFLHLIKHYDMKKSAEDLGASGQLLDLVTLTLVTSAWEAGVIEKPV